MIRRKRTVLHPDKFAVVDELQTHEKRVVGWDQVHDFLLRKTPDHPGGNWSWVLTSPLTREQAEGHVVRMKERELERV